MNNPQQIAPLGAFCNILPQDSYPLHVSNQTFKPQNFEIYSLKVPLCVDTRNKYVGRIFYCTSQDVNIIFPFKKLKTHFIPYLTARQHYIINDFLINTEDRVGHLLTCNSYNLTDLYTLTVQSD